MKKDILILFAVFVLAAALIMGTDFQTVDEYYLTHNDDVTPDSQTVTISVSCEAVLDAWDKLDPALSSGGYIPEDGIMVEETVCVLRPGDTVFDILYRTLVGKKIQFEYQGAEKNAFGTVYVQGIGYLYENDCGSYSGWTYKVNDSYPDVGCSDYKLSDGDRIQWIYVCSVDEMFSGGDGE